MTALWPNLSVRRGREAVAFYVEAFGATVQFQIGGTDDEPSTVAQLAVGDAVFWVSDESPADGNPGPETLAGSSVRLQLIVDDPAAVLAQAVAAGAVEVYPVAGEYGWEIGRVRDPFGHDWELARPLVKWPPGGFADDGPTP